MFVSPRHKLWHFVAATTIVAHRDPYVRESKKILIMISLFFSFFLYPEKAPQRFGCQVNRSHLDDSRAVVSSSSPLLCTRLNHAGCLSTESSLSQSQGSSSQARLSRHIHTVASIWENTVWNSQINSQLLIGETIRVKEICSFGSSFSFFSSFSVCFGIKVKSKSWSIVM